MTLDLAAYVENIAEGLAELWTSVMPNAPKPNHDKFIFWAAWFPERVARQGIRSAARQLETLRLQHRPVNEGGAIGLAESAMRRGAEGKGCDHTR